MHEPWRILYVGKSVKDKHSLKLEQTDFSFSSGQDLCGGNVLLLFCVPLHPLHSSFSLSLTVHSNWPLQHCMVYLAA